MDPIAFGWHAQNGNGRDVLVRAVALKQQWCPRLHSPLGQQSGAG